MGEASELSGHGFHRTRSGRVVARLGAGERQLLAGLARQLIELVEPEQGPPADPLARMVGIDPDAVTPTDPALARLLPDGYGGQEPEASAEFRRFTERSLREGKATGARSVLASLERSGAKVVLSQDLAQAWLGTLNDLRLTLGTRLEMDEDPDVTDQRIEGLVARLQPGQADGHAAMIAREALAAYQAYDWLTFLQETLVRAVLGFGIDLDPDA